MQCWHWLPRVSTAFTHWGQSPPQDTLCCTHQMQALGFPSHPNFSTTGYKFEAPHYLLRFDNLLKFQRTHREAILKLSFTIIDTNQDKTNLETHRVGSGRVSNVKLPCYQDASPFWHIDVCYHPGSLSSFRRPKFLLGFYYTGMVNGIIGQMIELHR